MFEGPLAASARASCWFIATALSLQEITIVQLGGAAAPATTGQVTVDCGFGSRALSDAAQRARSNAARFTTPVAPPQTAAVFAVPTQVWMVSGVLSPAGRAVLAAACSAGSVEMNCPVALALKVVVTGGVA